MSLRQDVKLVVGLLEACSDSRFSLDVVDLAVNILKRSLDGEEQGSTPFKSFRVLLNEHYQKYHQKLVITATEIVAGYLVTINGTNYSIDSPTKKAAIEKACEQFYYTLAGSKD